MHLYQKTLSVITMLASFQVGAATLATANEIDDVLITSRGISFGGSTYANNAPSSPARVEWNQRWWGSTHVVNGTIHFEGTDGSCVRVRVTAFNDNGKIGTFRDSNVECAVGNAYQSYPVSVEGEVGATEVRVRLQSLAVNGTWGTIGRQVVIYGPYVGSTDVMIRRQEFKFGSGELINNAPENPASVAWNVDPVSSIAVPVVTGTLYAINADDLCVRMRYRYKNEINDNLDTRYGYVHCITGDAEQRFDVFADDYAGNQSVTELRVTIQRSSADINGQSLGNWTNVGGTTTYLPTVPVVEPFPNQLP